MLSCPVPSCQASQLPTPCACLLLMSCQEMTYHAMFGDKWMRVRGAVNTETRRMQRMNRRECSMYLKCFLLFPNPNWIFFWPFRLLDKCCITFFPGIFPWDLPSGTITSPLVSSPLLWSLGVRSQLVGSCTDSHPHHWVYLIESVYGMSDKAACLPRLSILTKC